MSTSDPVSLRPPSRALGIAAVVAVMLAIGGLAVRVSGLHGSLWLDEFSTLWAIEAGFREMLRRVPQVMGQSPLYYSIAWASVHSLGESEIALRLPSLLSVIGATIAVGAATARLSGRKSGVWAGLLFWLSYPAIWESVDARPYGLSLLFAAIAAAGLLGACLTGRIRDRALWIAGAAGLVWSHYVFSPWLCGLAAGYSALSELRTRYTWRLALMDAGLILLLVAPTGVQVATLFASRSSQGWMSRPNVAALVVLLAPFALAAWFPTARRRIDRQRRGLRTALSIAVFTQLASLAAGLVLGIDLADSRYAVVVVVAAAILAGDTLGRIRAADTTAPLAVYVLATGLTLAGTKQVLGSFSGAGFQQWREAVAALRPEVAASPLAPVLFRSGNAEDDLGAPGVVRWPATLAPLRSPGTQPPDWNVALLTYRWKVADRSSYFRDGLLPRLANSTTVFMLCLYSAEPGTHGYCEDVLIWINQQWPGRFEERSIGAFRSLKVVRLDRVR